MQTSFSPLIGRAEFFKPQGIELVSEIQPESSPAAPLTSLQLIRLQIQDVAKDSIKKGIFKVTTLTPPLTGRRFTTGVDVKSSKMFSALRKTAQAELVAIQKAIDAEIIQNYIEECMQNLKDSLKMLFLDLCIKKQNLKESVRKLDN